MPQVYWIVDRQKLNSVQMYRASAQYMLPTSEAESMGNVAIDSDCGVASDTNERVGEL